MRAFRCLAFVAITCLLAGCASFFGHYDYVKSNRVNTPTAYYPGTVTDCTGIALGLSAPLVAPFNKDIELWQVVFAPLCLVDLPFSFVLDTLFLPSDFLLQREERLRKADVDPFWDHAFRAGTVMPCEALQHLDDANLGEVIRLLHAHNGGNASNVVDVIFGVAMTNSIPRLTIALCGQRGFGASQYRQLYTVARSGVFGSDGLAMMTVLARNPALPMDLLREMASAPELEIATAAFGAGRLPLDVTTNMLMRFAYSDSKPSQDIAVSHAATHPDALRHLARTVDAAGLVHRRTLLAWNPSCPPDLLAEFAHDADDWLRIVVAKHPSTPPGTLNMLAADRDPRAREQVAKHPATPPAALNTLATDREPKVRAAALKNPRKPARQACNTASRAALSPAIESALVLHYGFDTDEGGIAIDTSGYGRTGRVCRATWVKKGVRGGAMQFHDNRSQIRASDAGLPSGDDPRSIAMWMRIDIKYAEGVTRMFAYGTDHDPGQSCALALDWRPDRGRVGFSTGGKNFLTTGKSPEPGTWIHVTYTYDGKGEHHLYLNGVRQAGESELRGQSLDTRLSGLLLLGGHPDAYGPHDGFLDEVMIFNRALTETEVGAIHACGM